MKKLLVCLVLFGVLLSACKDSSMGDGVYFIDLNEDYPARELVLQDLVKVEYVSLETDSVFLLSSVSPWFNDGTCLGYVDNKTGNVLFFEAPTGKKSFLINRRGQGPEEYVYSSAITKDPVSDEVFVNSTFESAFKVYSAEGGYLRTLPYCREKGKYEILSAVENFNDSLLICTTELPGGPVKGDIKKCFLLHKRIPGWVSLIDSIGPEQGLLNTIVMKDTGNGVQSMGVRHLPVGKYKAGVCLSESTNDTIFLLAEDLEKKPYIVRSPSVRSTEPQVLLRYDGETSEWIFLTAIDLDFDFQTNQGFEERNLGLNKKEGQVYEISLVDRNDKSGTNLTFNERVIPIDEPVSLIEKRDEGLLQGDLKSIAETLDEDDNGVLILVSEKE